MIALRFQAAWRAFRSPEVFRHPESLRTESMQVVNTAMDAAIATCRYVGAAEDDDWWMGYLGAHSEIRGQLISLKMKLLLEMAYSEREAA